jgi:hypothetical protein
LYLAVVLDAWSRRVGRVGDGDASSGLSSVLDALNMAVTQRRPTNA